MINIFKRKAKRAPAAPAATERAAEAPQLVPVMEAAPVEATSNSQTIAGEIPDSVSWSGTSINDELIRVEEKWQDGALVVRADLPGMDPDRDIRLTVLNRHLIIEAERRQRDTINADGYVIDEASCTFFTRSVPLRDGVDAPAIAGTYKDGVLEVRIPMPADAASEPAIRIPIST